MKKLVSFLEAYKEYLNDKFIQSTHKVYGGISYHQDNFPSSPKLNQLHPEEVISDWVVVEKIKKIEKIKKYYVLFQIRDHIKYRRMQWNVSHYPVESIEDFLSTLGDNHNNDRYINIKLLEETEVVVEKISWEDIDSVDENLEEGDEYTDEIRT